MREHHNTPDAPFDHYRNILVIDPVLEQDNAGARVIDFSLYRARRMLRAIEDEYLARH